MSTPASSIPLPTPVAAALARLATMVERRGNDWLAGDQPATDTAALTAALYATWYTQPAKPASPAPDDPPLHQPSLLGPLRAAAAAAMPPIGPWTVTGSDPRGTLAAMKGESARLLRPGDYLLAARPGMPPAPGEPVTVVTPLDHLDPETGIWWLFGEPPPQRPLGRVYLNARPATAPRVVHEVATALAARSFQLKCPVLTAACERVDAIVLYHPLAERDEVLAALEARWPHLGPLLDPDTPPLTNPRRPGMAWADDVDEAHSFGEHRCGLLATGITGADDAWAGLGREARVALLAAALRAGGVDPARPWEASS